MACSADGGELRASARAMLAAVSILLGICAPARAQDEALRSYYTANGLLNRGLYEQAAAEYQAFLASDPTGVEDATARYGLAVALSQLGKPDDALALLTSLRPPDGFAFQFEAGLLQGQLVYAKQDFGEASRILGRLVRRNPDHARADEAAGLWIECLHRLGDHRQTVAREQELEDDERLAAGDLGRARLFAALSQSMLGDDEAAANSLSRLAKRDDEIGRSAALSLAAVLERLGRPAEAADRYQGLISLQDPRWSPPAMLGAARSLRSEGQASKAATILRDLMDRYPDSDSSQEAGLELGIALIETGDYAAGRDALGKQSPNGDPASAGRAAYWFAKSLLREGKAKAAAARLESALKQFPDSPLKPEMLYDLGVALSQLGEPERAVEVFQRIASELPTAKLAPTAQLAAAVTLLGAGHADEAFTQASEIASDAPEGPEAALVLAEVEATRGRNKQAVDLLRQWMRAHPDHPAADRARYRLALCLAALDQREEAERIAEPLLGGTAIDPRFVQGLIVLGDAAFRDEDWPAAERWFRSAIERGATPPDAAQLRLALALARQGKSDEASGWFERAAAGDSAGEVGAQAKFELAQAKLLAGHDEQAGPMFESLLADAPDSRFAGYAMRQLGGIAERRGDPAAAASWYQRAANASEEVRPDALRDQARAALAAGDYQTPEQLAKGSHDPDLRAYGAIAAARRGEYAPALKAMDEAINAGGLSDDVRRDTLFERAWCARRQGDDASAARTLDAILAEDRQDRYAVYAALESASIALDAGRAADAAQPLDRAAKLMETQPAIVEPAMQEQLTYRHAAMDSALGRHADVIERLQHFDEQYPKSTLAPPANILLGDAYVATARPSEAADAYRRAAESPSDETQGAALLRLGDALGRSGAWAKSREAFEQYLADHADSPFAYEAQFGRAWALEHEGDTAKAREAYAKVVAAHQGPTAARAQFQIGECLFAEGRHEEAVRELLRVDILYQYPEWSAAALYEAGRAFEQLRKFGEARQQYRETLERFPESDWGPLARERLGRLASEEGRE
ncbi:MAG: tetratricopeptide repeat protein [Phycisphaerales bacterium]|nr:tetratricopeptide repeat protein [Phycisphaerales bacterium]